MNNIIVRLMKQKCVKNISNDINIWVCQTFLVFTVIDHKWPSNKWLPPTQLLTLNDYSSKHNRNEFTAFKNHLQNSVGIMRLYLTLELVVLVELERIIVIIITSLLPRYSFNHHAMLHSEALLDTLSDSH